MAARAQSNPQIELPARNPPIAVFFVVVPALTVVALIATLLGHPLPTPLLAMLLVVGASCLFLIKEAIGHLGPVRIEMTAQELIVKRVLGGESYPWSQIESVRLFDPGATFSDGGRHGEGRAGLGLFLRQPGKAERLPDAEPDVLIVSRGGDDAEAVIKASERITAAKRSAGSGRDPRRPGMLGGKATRPSRKAPASK
jgi:hypothetical protein